MKNLKEFKALIERYESITLEEIKNTDVSLPNIDVLSIAIQQVTGIYKLKANRLTGFGSHNTCSLCEGECEECVYLVIAVAGCNQRGNKKTFRRICNASSPIKLRNAFRARAKHMKTLLKTKS